MCSLTLCTNWKQARTHHDFTRTTVLKPILRGLPPPGSQEEPRTGSHTEFGVKQKGKGEKAKAICSGTFTGGDGDPTVPTGGRGVSRWARGTDHLRVGEQWCYYSSREPKWTSISSQKDPLGLGHSSICCFHLPPLVVATNLFVANGTNAPNHSKPELGSSQSCSRGRPAQQLLLTALKNTKISDLLEIACFQKAHCLAEFIKLNAIAHHHPTRLVQTPICCSHLSHSPSLRSCTSNP